MIKQDKKLKIGLLNVGYSPNLGDGLIAECMSFTLSRFSSGVELDWIDLAGRSAYSQGTQQKRLASKVIGLLPAVLRRWVVGFILDMLITFRLRSFYRAKLAGVQVVVLGGGNLLSDNDLNFPKKIYAALSEAARLALPVHVWGVGVSAEWSEEGRQLFHDAFSMVDLRSVAVRDQRSKLLWEQALPGVFTGTVEVVLDPGVSVSRVFKKDRPVSYFGSPPVIGIGVMSAHELHYHGATCWNDDNLLNWYVALISELRSKNYSLNIFTNGNPDDRVFSKKLIEKLHDEEVWCDHVFDLTSSINTPEQLCKVISECDGVIAFRMHAIVAALSYGVPFVALDWNAKLRAFLLEVGKEKYVIDANVCQPSEVFNLMAEAILMRDAAASDNLVQVSVTSLAQLAARLSGFKSIDRF